MKVQIIPFIFLTVISIHYILKSYASIKKGLRPNYLILGLSLICLVSSILGLILVYGGA